VNPGGRSGVYRAMRTQLPVHDPPVAYATPTESGPTDSGPTDPPPAQIPPESIDLTVVSISPPRDFEAFYREAYADIARALTATLGDFDLAQEATDEAMVRAYVRWEKVRSYDNPGGWVYRVGLNWARSARRRLTRVLPFHERRVVDPPTSDPAHYAALRDLDVSLRAVVVCRLLLDWSVDQTATALRLKPGTVKSRLHRAIGQLERTLGETS
jgi:DNA-directed RNA polymerase specialized sigma24 family protein